MKTKTPMMALVMMVWLFTLTNASSPSHKGEQEWHGLKNPLFWPHAGIHALQELWPNRWQRQEVVDNLRDYYQRYLDGCNGGWVPWR